MSSNPAHGEVYLKQHYVIKFVSGLRQVGGFLRVLWFPPPINLTAMHDITETIVESGVNHHSAPPCWSLQQRRNSPCCSTISCFLSTCCLRVNIAFLTEPFFKIWYQFCKWESMECNIGQNKIFETYRNCSTFWLYLLNKLAINIDKCCISFDKEI